MYNYVCITIMYNYVFMFGLCTLFYQSRISEISVLALTREIWIPHFLHTCGTIYCWETGTHISNLNEVLLQLKLHWACDFFLIYSTIYLASPNKKFYRIQTQKIDRCRTSTHNTTHKNKMSRCLPTPSGFALYLHGNICHGPKSWCHSSPQSVAGAWRWVCCSCHGWFPWLGRQINMHWKIERGMGPWP